MQRLVCGMRARGGSSLLRRALCAASPPSQMQQRWLSSAPPADVELRPRTGEQRHNEETAHLPSTDVRAEGDAAFDEDFDELEAASQELHDLCYAMIAHLRFTDPSADKSLFERRVKRSLREPKPERTRRLIHEHGDRSCHRRNNYLSAKDFHEANKLFLEWGNKVLLLLTKPVLDRLVQSAGKGHRDLRSDGVHQYRRPLDRATWRTFPHRWFKHAPFEVQQLRADIPQSAVLNTRFYRDHATLRYLFTLMEPQHAFRSPIEQRLFDLTKSYDPASSLGKR
ncbi:putative mitochondrial hypothetical protein [Leptomonas pyrrhocoris]|uniref:Uncharacterized protein n=1 Tax=Leptomonas pyrrhocoris TaxID=157538 RepID=A0A0N1J4T7_LEPPY|nr:putative mitochondrial hypothetical protein [Leptomonas pyrrhocoris]KPA80258.1 putative mitochondrial hypothetical protein [Leptomonas pyrrhocoris]|eukprot:XP_015658697.1 putative mitochondrial hypothetical protein [Leptomonas pyrrhocoris]